MRMTYIRNGETLRLDGELCNGCGRCIEVCPHEVFVMTDAKAWIADRAACMECGACANNCEPGAITVRAGVGCATAVISGMLRGTGPDCSCGGGRKGGCCG
ncbi:MAG TPA: mercury methylation ferredoxin HgcB [Spirochaetia bacterium]|nr:mercury methylation ferredoxin HgcB [Spirochaetia bacterium]